MKAGVKPGLDMHLLGATMFTLMFGPRLAILGLSLVLAGVTLNNGLLGREGWEAYALNALALAVFPALLADAIRRVVDRCLPGNFFIYVFVTAFFGAAITAMASGVLACGLLWLAGVYPARFMRDEKLAKLDRIRTKYDPEGRFQAWMGRIQPAVAVRSE